MKAVITDDAGRILLLREQNGSWELPGGGLEHTEQAREALTREIAEETGMTATWVSGQPAAFWTIHKDVGSPTLQWFAFVAYAATVSGEFQPDLSDEAHEARYFDRAQIASLELHDNTKPYFQPEQPEGQ